MRMLLRFQPKNLKKKGTHTLTHVIRLFFPLLLSFSTSSLRFLVIFSLFFPCFSPFVFLWFSLCFPPVFLPLFFYDFLFIFPLLFSQTPPWTQWRKSWSGFATPMVVLCFFICLSPSFFCWLCFVFSVVVHAPFFVFVACTLFFIYFIYLFFFS